MKNYECIIMSQDKVKEICGEKMTFIHGFMDDGGNKPDFWNLLEEHLNKPIVTIRPSGRESWDEILILCANGYLRGDKRVLRGDANYIQTCLMDIFFEAENDECEVFEWYEFETDEDTVKEIYEWMQIEFDYELD